MIYWTCRNVIRKSEQCASSTLQYYCRPFSSMKNPPATNNKDDNPKKKEKLTPIEETVSWRKKLDEGFQFGNWKFYPESFVFQNLRPDILPKSYQMCFRSSLETFANLSICGAAGLSLFTPLAIWNLINGISSIYSFMENSIICFATFSTILSIYYVALKVPLRIYYSNEDNNFIVVMPRFLPFSTTRVLVAPGQVLPPTKSSPYLPWVNIEHIHTVTKRKMIITDTDFKLPMYYKKLVGY